MSYRRVWPTRNFTAVLTVPYHLAIIEDQAPIRETLAEYLCAQPEFCCGLVAGSIEEFLALVAQAPVPPQLILSDIGLPGLTGIEGLPLIRAQLPEAQVIMLSVYADAERVYQALCAGAVGYLLKDTPLLEPAASSGGRLAHEPRRGPARGARVSAPAAAASPDARRGGAD
jgi:DNA-binding NtrC family response regulator